MSNPTPTTSEEVQLPGGNLNPVEKATPESLIKLMTMEKQR